MSEPNTPGTPSRLKLLWEAIRDSLRHNWGYKLLAFVLALMLWAGLIAQDASLTRTKVMPDTSVSVNGRATMENRGLVITGGLPEDLTVEIRADVPQLQYQNAAGSDYNPRIDLSRVTSAGVQEVEIATTSTSAYGSVLSVNPSSVTLTVEQQTTRSGVILEILPTGELPDGWYLRSAQVDIGLLQVGSSYRYVTVRGPKSLVDRVDRVQAVFELDRIDVSKRNGTRMCTIRPVDASGQPIDTAQMDIISDEQTRTTCYVIYELLPTKLVPVSMENVCTGTPADGCSVTGVTVEPAAIRMAGLAADLDTYDSFSLQEPVSINGASQDVRQTMRLKDLPSRSGIIFLNEDGAEIPGSSISVTVTIHISKPDAEAETTGTGEGP